MLSLDKPYPLFSRFVRLVLPLLLVSLGIFLWSVFNQNKMMSEKLIIKLERTHLQAVLDDQLAHDAALRELIYEKTISPSKLKDSKLKFKKRLERESKIRSYLCAEFILGDNLLRVGYTPSDLRCETLDRKALMSLRENPKGFMLEQFPQPGASTVVLPLSIYNGPTGGAIAVVSKPSHNFQDDLHKSFISWGVFAFAVFGIAIGASWILIRNAQRSIDQQVLELVYLRKQISRYVSADTVQAVMDSEKSDLASSRSEQTLLFMDIRDFSSYVEHENLDNVVSLLNDIISIAAEAVVSHQGDVNKVVGDGILATFRGDDRRSRALHAAEDVIEKVNSLSLPRGVGLGIHDGEVISAAIGRGIRRDHTVFGQAVNQAARLCSIAKAGEIVSTVEAIPSDSVYQTCFSSEECITLKGHTQWVRIRRYTPEIST